MKTKTAILILAAGSSSRMGKPKQLLKWRNTSLIENVIQQSLNSKAEKVFVVLGANAKKITSEIDFKTAEVIENEHWKNGMGTSITCGVEYINKRLPKVRGILIALADQPYITSAYYNRLIEAFAATSKRIVATKNNGKLGVPAIFNSFYFSELMMLNEDKGARKIISTHKSDVEVITSKIDFTDIDTLEEYENLQNK